MLRRKIRTKQEVDIMVAIFIGALIGQWFSSPYVNIPSMIVLAGVIIKFLLLSTTPIDNNNNKYQ